MKYKIVIAWSTEDNAYIATAPALPGCAADGATYQESLANLESVMREWIEAAQADGRPIPKPDHAAR